MRAPIVVLLAAACGGEARRPPAPPPTPIELVTLAPTQVVDSSEYLGALRSRLSATLQPQVDGQVADVLVQPGDTVEQGQPLVRIDPGRQPAAVTQARQQRAARQAQLQLAQRNLDRVQRLVATGALPEQELDNARAAVESAKADVAALGAEITSSQVQLGYYTIAAPGHGVVGDIPVRVGDHVTPQTVITTVTDNRVLEANVSVPVERASALALGMPVQVVGDQGRVLGAGPISFVSPQVNADTQSVLVKADLDNAAGALRAGQVVRARIVWRTHPGLTVPALAVTRQGEQRFVYVAAPAGQGLVAKQRPVQLGELTNGAFVVASGLAAGDRIVTSQIQKLHDGAPITQAAPPATARAAPPAPRSR